MSGCFNPAALKASIILPVQSPLPQVVVPGNRVLPLSCDFRQPNAVDADESPPYLR